ncbi:MAG: hypothetical protein ABEK50_06475 [bacterium]
MSPPSDWIPRYAISLDGARSSASAGTAQRPEPADYRLQQPPLPVRRPGGAKSGERLDERYRLRANEIDMRAAVGRYAERVRDHVVTTLAAYEGEPIEAVLLAQAKQETSPSLKLSMASELLRRENQGGLPSCSTCSSPTLRF